MGVRQEVEHSIRNGWVDSTVAEWVIKNFPLLEYAGTHSPCPIYTLNLGDGLILSNPEYSAGVDYLGSYKIVMSGGFEGTRGHLRAISDMHEYRTLTTGPGSLMILMLEPDSYVRTRKKT